MAEYIFDRKESDVLKRNPKGTYNAGDLNRVGRTAEEIGLLVKPMGYIFSGIFRIDWQEGEIPSAEDMEHYLTQVHLCKRGFPDVGVPLPATMEGLDYIGANNIEQIFYEIEQAASLLQRIYIPCGTAMCNGGELY